MATRGEVLESNFQSRLIIRLNALLDGDGYVVKMDTSYIQGFPDIMIIYKDRWAALECKRSSCAEEQPNQRYYVNHLNGLSFAAFIYPGNEEEVINGLRQALRIRGSCASESE